MSIEFVYRDADGTRHTEVVSEERARELLGPHADEALRVMLENPGGQMNCDGGYLHHVP